MVIHVVHRTDVVNRCNFWRIGTAITHIGFALELCAFGQHVLDDLRLAPSGSGRAHGSAPCSQVGAALRGVFQGACPRR